MRRIFAYFLASFVLLIFFTGVALSGDLQMDLNYAAEYGDIEKARKLLNEGANVNGVWGSFGYTPLHVAVKYGKKDLALFLIEKGANVNANPIAEIHGRSEGTPLHIAAVDGKKDMALFLIEKGANVNAKDNDEYGITPLHRAASGGHKEVVKLLIEKGADVNAKKSNTWTALHDAAFEGKKDMVLFLIENGANVNKETGEGDTPLHLAAYKGHNEVVGVLLEKGADQRARNKYSYIPLHTAVYEGKAEVVRLLLEKVEKGGDVNARTDDDRTPLYFAAQGGQKKIAQLLIEKGADVNAETDYSTGSWTPLHAAASGGYKEIVQLLIEKGADVNKKDTKFRTPLHNATDCPIWGGYKEGAEPDAVVLLLLEKGGDVNAKTFDDGNTPLHFAASCGKSKIIAPLIEKGADVDAKNYYKEYDTPLHVAARYGHKDAVLSLIEKGADPGIPNANGKTPLQLAKEKNHTTIALVLEEEEKEFVKKLFAKKTEPEKAGQNIPKPVIPDFKSAPRPDDLAVVIGIENYQGLPRSDFSKSDAGIVKDYLKAMGFQDRNIEFIADEKATKSKIETAIEGWLPNKVKKDSRIIVYYSGHGAPELKTGDTYIVPYDGDPNYLTTSGYSLKRLYDNLGKLQVAEVVVLLDSCFSGAGGRSVLAQGARPLVMMANIKSIPSNMAILSATQGSQISTSSPEKGHGIFTYYFLKALKDGKKTIAEIYEYIKPLVEDEAKQINVQQSPSITPDIEKIKGRFILRK